MRDGNRRSRRLAAAITAVLGVGLVSATVSGPAAADTIGPITFETPTYAAGTIHGQDGWSKTGGYDAEVELTSDFAGDPPSFGTQTFRISNTTTSGSFGDQAISKSVVNEAGETDAVNGGLSGGARQRFFVAEYTVASSTGAEQTGLGISVAVDRGDGSRMSQVRFEHNAGNLDIIFSDVQGVPGQPCSQCANFVLTDLGNFNEAVPHTIRHEIEYVDGAGNDVVRVYVDGVLAHTGTSWEDYYRFDGESGATGVSRTSDSLIFLARGTAATGTLGNGFLFDSVSVATGAKAAPDAAIRTGLTGSDFKQFGFTSASVTPQQSAKDTAPVGISRTFRFRAANIGDFDGAFTVTGSPDHAGFRIKYYDQNENNITSAVLAGTHEVDVDASAQSPVLKVRIKPSGQAAVNAKARPTITFESEDGEVDVVRAVLKRV